MTVEIVVDTPEKQHRPKPPSNSRENWAAAANRAKAQRAYFDQALQDHRPPLTPALVTLVLRTPASIRMDSDNLVAGLKYARDAAAAWIGCGDSPSDPIRWRYAEERATVYGVRIVAETVDSDDPRWGREAWI